MVFFRCSIMRGNFCHVGLTMTLGSLHVFGCSRSGNIGTSIRRFPPITGMVLHILDVSLKRSSLMPEEWGD